MFYKERYYLTLTVLLAAVSTASVAFAKDGAKIYYVRHAETMGNVTRNYTDENQRIFSEYGKSQVDGIADKLGQYEFDYIAVSPTWRTRQTVLPYLIANDRVGLIWPEIEEGGCDLRGDVEPAAELVQGDRVAIQPQNNRWLALRDDETTHRYEQRNDKESLAVYLRGVDLLKKQFGGTGKRVLLVSHSCTGSRLFELLLSVAPRGRFSPMNASVTLLEEDENGVYSLVQFNDKPFRQSYSWSMPEFCADAEHAPLMKRTLNAQYFGEASDEPYRVDWVLRGAGGAQFLVQGSKTFRLDENTEGKLTDIAVDLSEIPLGAECTVDLELSRGDVLLQDWTEKIKIPLYFGLTGKWKIRAGDDSGWQEPAADDSDWQVTSVPGGWENDALPDYDGTAWYRYHFAIPDAWKETWGDQPLAIVFGGIDDADYTYLNGKQIGQAGRFPPDKKTAYDTRRVYPVDRDLIRDDGNVLAVRVSDWTGGGGIWKGPVAIGPIGSFDQ